MKLPKYWIQGVALAILPIVMGAAKPNDKYLDMPGAAEARRSPAYRYANMSNSEAYAELDARGVKYQKQKRKAGVRAPIRLTAPLRGVWIHSVLPEEQRVDTPFEILDARLALALYDAAEVFRLHDIVEIVHFTMYRPPGTQGSHDEEDEEDERGMFRHPGGLAIDLGAMKKKNGNWLAIGPHWPSDIGATTCGAEQKKLVPRRAKELMSMLCELADLRSFTYMLTPHFDKAHDDHFHLEIKPGVEYFSAH